MVHVIRFAAIAAALVVSAAFMPQYGTADSVDEPSYNVSATMALPK